LDIFRAVCRWIKANQDDEDPEVKIKVLSAVRYPLMSLDELLSVVRESQLVSSDNILDAIQLRNTLPSHKLKFRGQLSTQIWLIFKLTLILLVWFGNNLLNLLISF